MKIRRLFALILTFSLLFASFGILTVNAEDKYADLFEQKLNYFYDLWSRDLYSAPSSYWGIHYAFPSELDLTLLLYTETAKSFTFKKVVEEDIDYSVSGDPPHWSSNGEACFSGEDFYVACPEIDKIVEKNYVFRGEGKSYLRACVQACGISKEEIIAARKKAQEDPESIRELLPFLTDEEFESAKNYKTGLYVDDIIPDYAIEALYIKDDAVANSLLGIPEAVYVKEIGRMVTINELSFNTPEKLNEQYVNVEDLNNFDLTGEGFGAFIEWRIRKIGRLNDLYKEVNSIREYQLANPKPPSTGEAWYLIPAALVSLALGVLVIYPRKKKNI